MKIKTLAALALATLPLSFQATAEDWYPSAYGANDEIGAANLLTTDVVKHAVSLVRTGKTYPLAVPVDKNLPAFRHRSFRLYNVQVGQQAGTSLGPNKFTFNDELVNAWTGVGTQLNGIGHIGIDNVYYNGSKAADFVTVDGAQARRREGTADGHPRRRADMTAYYGKAIARRHRVHRGRHPGRAEEAGPEPAQGRRGAVQHRLAGTDRQGQHAVPRSGAGYRHGGREVAGRPGHRRLVATPGPRRSPEPARCRGVPINQHMLAKRGIYNLELIDSRALVRDKA